MRTYLAEAIGKKQSLTPEGFLLCEEVPIARTGTMHYAVGELVEEGRVIKPATDGVIYASRSADEIFRPETMASFEGKTLTDDHPDDDVTPVNWKEFAVGHLQNVRKGEGALKDLLIADLIVKDADAIAAVREGKREVSCGYDFEIEELGQGRVRQFNIIGNHVALVEQGRCGPRCSIGDKDMIKRNLWDRVSAALKAKDEAALKEVLEGKDEEGLDPGKVANAGGPTININMPGTGGGDKPAAKADDEEADKDDPFKKLTASVDGLCNTVKDFGTRLEKLESAGANDADTDEDDDTTGANDAEGEEEDDKDKDKDKGAKGKDGGKAKDSAGLVAAFQDTIARAEILSPGIKVPALDKKAEPGKTQDAMCAFRRRALDRAYSTDVGKSAIDPLLAGGKLDTKKMSCGEARILFVGASDNMKRLNNEDGDDGGTASARDHGSVQAKDIAGLNTTAADFWAKRGGTPA